MRLTNSYRGDEHHITIPRHKSLRVGTLSRILKDVSLFLDIDIQQLIGKLFNK